MKKIHLLCLLASISISAMAQQDQIYTHYDFNTLSINPAYAGSNAKMNVGLLSRRQWTSLPGAPNYNTFTLSNALNNDFAMGVNVKQGTIGSFKNASPLKELGISANLAYHKTITSKLRLAVGLKLGYFNYVFDISKLDINQQNDPTFGKTSMNIHAPTTGFGTYLYSDRFFLGFSCPQMLFLQPDEINYQNLNHYQLSGGYVIPYGDKANIKITSQVRATKGSPVQMDFNAHYMLNDLGSIGAFYRTEGDLGLMLMAKIKKSVQLFYSWDSKIQPLNEYVRYSHEFGLQYSIPYEKLPSRQIIPRFF
jgi:type IX secretion system PorP/SprF family membrane protein